MVLSLTPLTIADAEAIHALVRRWETHWQVPIVTPPSEIIDDLTHPGFVPALDTIGVWSGAHLVAYGSVHHSRSGIRLERAYLSGMVDPACVGQGLGRRLLAWQIERAAALLRTCDPALPWFVRTNEWDWVSTSHRLYARLGLRPVRWFEEMVRSLDIPSSLSVPAGAQVVPWSEAPPEETRIAANESFLDHWGSTPRDAGAWHHLITSSDVRLDLSFVAIAEGRVVGVCLNHHFPSDEEVTGRRDGWIGILGVTKPWRQRGVATALMSHSFQAFRDAGFSHAMLGVDTDNPSGAAGLYREVGFQPLHRSVTYELEIRH